MDRVDATMVHNSSSNSSSNKKSILSISSSPPILSPDFPPQFRPSTQRTLPIVTDASHRTNCTLNKSSLGTSQRSIKSTTGSTIGSASTQSTSSYCIPAGSTAGIPAKAKSYLPNEEETKTHKHKIKHKHKSNNSTCSSKVSNDSYLSSVQSSHNSLSLQGEELTDALQLYDSVVTSIHQRRINMAEELLLDEQDYQRMLKELQSPATNSTNNEQYSLRDQVQSIRELLNDYHDRNAIGKLSSRSLSLTTTTGKLSLSKSSLERDTNKHNTTNSRSKKSISHDSATSFEAMKRRNNPLDDSYATIESTNTPSDGKCSKNNNDCKKPWQEGSLKPKGMNKEILLEK